MKRNPFVDGAKSESNLLKNIQSQLDFHQIKKLSANDLLKMLYKADPTEQKVFTPWLLQCFVTACDENRVADFINDLGLANDYLKIWVSGQASLVDGRYVERPINMPWADQKLLGAVSGINELGSLLVDLKLMSTEYQGDWIQTALFLQSQGDCFVLGDTRDGAGNRWVFVDLITHKASTELGKDSGWCTASGAFYSYIPNTGLIMGYCIETAERIQVTSRNEDNYNMFENEDDEDYWDEGFEGDGFFQEQKLPNNVVLKFKGKYAPLKGYLASVANQVQIRVRLADKNCLRLAIENIQAGGGEYTGMHKELYEAYEGKVNMPPLLLVKQHYKRLGAFMSISPRKKLNQKDVREFHWLLQYIPSNLFVLELATLQHPIIPNQYLPKEYWMSRSKSDVEKGKNTNYGFVTVPKGSYKTLGGDIVAQLRGFEMAKYETTQLLWLYVMNDTRPIDWGVSPLAPIVNVSWYDSCEFCNRLSEIAGLQPCYIIEYDEKGNHTNVDWDWNANGYRLPTEAEWEAAARDNTDFTYAGSNDPDDVAWYYKEDTQDEEGNVIPADNRIHPVGQKKPNTLGLYDMSGNVWEWCYDSYGSVEDKVEMPDYLPEE